MAHARRAEALAFSTPFIMQKPGDLTKAAAIVAGTYAAASSVGMVGKLPSPLAVDAAATLTNSTLASRVVAKALVYDIVY